MNSWLALGNTVREWLTLVWDGIFGVELFHGLTGKVLILGLFAICFSIWVIRYLVDNTHPNIQSESVYSSGGSYYRPKHARSNGAGYVGRHEAYSGRHASGYKSGSSYQGKHAR